jgi:hypothetical protein
MAIALHGILGLVGLVCFILVLVQMFQHGQTGLGIACAIGFCCFIGYLGAFIYGWVKAQPWNITNIMIIWSICFALSIVLNFAMPIPIDTFMPARP